jgi:hypothetical protein
MWKNIAAFAGMMALLYGCVKESGSEFIGKWSMVKGTQVLEIVRNGDAFLIKTTGPTNSFTGKSEALTLPATFKDGALHVNQGVFGDQVLVVEKSTGHLITGSASYKRL